MKVVLFGNGPLAARVLDVFLMSGDEVVGVVVHPAERAREREALLEVAERVGAVVVEGDNLSSSYDTLLARQPEIGVSAMFGYILRQELLDRFPRGCINIHPALLPFNRGAHPNVWPIVEGTPAGVTIHLIDAGVDTGAILVQQEVPVLPEDTALSIYDRLMDAAYKLFAANWMQIKSGELKASPQAGGCTFHRVSDLSQLDVLDLDAPTTAREVINLLRARTFPPYPGAYFVADDGRKIFVRLELAAEVQKT